MRQAREARPTTAVDSTQGLERLGENPMSWTDERVALLTKLWADGLSASQIAAELGGITRNAVIGKVHRLGLSGRAGALGAAGEAEAGHFANGGIGGDAAEFGRDLAGGQTVGPQLR